MTELQQLIASLADSQKHIGALSKLLKEIVSLDAKRDDNVFAIKARLTKIGQLISKPTKELEYIYADLQSWMEQYTQILSGSEGQIKTAFGNDLEQRLSALGLHLTGQYPDLHAGLFVVEVDFTKGKAVLWYGPKQEQLGAYPISATKVATELQSTRKRLGAQLPPNEFLNKLIQAYRRLPDAAAGKPAPIIAVQAEVAHAVQNKAYYQEPTRDNFRSYGRADFSYDLYKLRESGLGNVLKMEVAVREYTKQRSGFLWVPDDENGKGTTYSHLSIVEG